MNGSLGENAESIIKKIDIFKDADSTFIKSLKKHLENAVNRNNDITIDTRVSKKIPDCRNKSLQFLATNQGNMDKNKSHKTKDGKFIDWYEQCTGFKSSTGNKNRFKITKKTFIKNYLNLCMILKPIDARKLMSATWDDILDSKSSCKSKLKDSPLKLRVETRVMVNITERIEHSINKYKSEYNPDTEDILPDLNDHNGSMEDFIMREIIAINQREDLTLTQQNTIIALLYMDLKVPDLALNHTEIALSNDHKNGVAYMIKSRLAIKYPKFILDLKNSYLSKKLAENSYGRSCKKHLYLVESNVYSVFFKPFNYEFSIRDLFPCSGCFWRTNGISRKSFRRQGVGVHNINDIDITYYNDNIESLLNAWKYLPETLKEMDDSVSQETPVYEKYTTFNLKQSISSLISSGLRRPFNLPFLITTKQKEKFKELCERDFTKPSTTINLLSPNDFCGLLKLTNDIDKNLTTKMSKMWIDSISILSTKEPSKTHSIFINELSESYDHILELRQDRPFEEPTRLLQHITMLCYEYDLQQYSEKLRLWKEDIDYLTITEVVEDIADQLCVSYKNKITNLINAVIKDAKDAKNRSTKKTGMNGAKGDYVCNNYKIVGDFKLSNFYERFTGYKYNEINEDQVGYKVKRKNIIFIKNYLNICLSNIKPSTAKSMMLSHSLFLSELKSLTANDSTFKPSMYIYYERNIKNIIADIRSIKDIKEYNTKDLFPINRKCVDHKTNKDLVTPKHSPWKIKIDEIKQRDGLTRSQLSTHEAMIYLDHEEFDQAYRSSGNALFYDNKNGIAWMIKGLIENSFKKRRKSIPQPDKIWDITNDEMTDFLLKAWEYLPTSVKENLSIKKRGMPISAYPNYGYLTPAYPIHCLVNSKKGNILLKDKQKKKFLELIQRDFKDLSFSKNLLTPYDFNELLEIIYKIDENLAKKIAKQWRDNILSKIPYSSTEVVHYDSSFLGKMERNPSIYVNNILPPTLDSIRKYLEESVTESIERISNWNLFISDDELSEFLQYISNICCECKRQQRLKKLNIWYSNRSCIDNLTQLQVCNSVLESKLFKNQAFDQDLLKPWCLLKLQVVAAVSLSYIEQCEWDKLEDIVIENISKDLLESARNVNLSDLNSICSARHSNINDFNVLYKDIKSVFNTNIDFLSTIPIKQNQSILSFILNATYRKMRISIKAFDVKKLQSAADEFYTKK